MAATKLFEESQKQGGFYVPRFEVKIEGAGLPRDVVRDISSLIYKDNIDGLDTFEMIVNNWDDQRREYKYIGSETKAQLQPGHPDYARRTLMEPYCKEVLIQMGYSNRLVTMMKGYFTSMAPVFTDEKADMTVQGVNILHQLRQGQHTKTWKNEKDSNVAKSFNGTFPIPVVIDDNAASLEKPIATITQNNQHDIDFLFQRARQRGYVVFIQEADPVKGRPRQLYFGPSHAGMIPGLRDVMFELEWGKSLMEFKPAITTATQVTSVTVKGWHRTRRVPISRTVTLDHPRIRAVNPDLHRLIANCHGRVEMVVDEPVFTNCEALERAISILLEQLKQMVTADVKVVGLPDLRAGQIVTISNIGARLSGRYFITETTHTINDAGYITTFKCRREQS